MRDVRVYYYDGAGQLKKSGSTKGTHFHETYTEAYSYVSGLRRKQEIKDIQYVLVEYTSKYKSKIITIIE